MARPSPHHPENPVDAAVRGRVRRFCHQFDAKITDVRIDPPILLGQRPGAAADLQHFTRVRWYEAQQVSIDTIVVFGKLIIFTRAVAFSMFVDPSDYHKKTMTRHTASGVGEVGFRLSEGNPSVLAQSRPPGYLGRSSDTS